MAGNTGEITDFSKKIHRWQCIQKGERKTVDDKKASEEFAHKKKLWIYTSVDPVAFHLSGYNYFLHGKVYHSCCILKRKYYSQ